MNKLFRFCLEPGSALILIAAIEVINPLMSLMIDYSGAIVGKDLGLFDLGNWVYFWLILAFVECSISWSLLIYGVILKGNKKALIAWITTTSIFVFTFILIELYFINWTTPRITFNVIYLILVMIAIFSYQIHFAAQCLPTFATISDLEPIGKGMQFIWDFYKTHPKEAAMLVLMFEIVFNLLIFLDRQVSRFFFGLEFIGHESDPDLGIVLEDTVIRYIRIIWACIGFFIAYKEKKFWMFRWCLSYLFMLSVSIGVFLYLALMWRMNHALLTLTYFALMVINLLYRTGLLFVVVRYTDVFERRGIPM